MTTFDYPDQGMEPPFEHDDETVDGAHRRASVEWHRLKSADRAELIDNLAMDAGDVVRNVLRVSKMAVDDDAYEVLKACHDACRLEPDNGVLEWRMELEKRQPEHVPLLDRWIRRAAADMKLDQKWCDERAEQILEEEIE